MTTLTRKEYDRMSREGLELPRNFTLVEEDGREKGVCLSFGAENARMQNPDVRWAVECVADLVDLHLPGATKNVEFLDFLDSGDAFNAEHAEKLEFYVKNAVLRVEWWLKNRTEHDYPDLVGVATRSARVLREAKFGVT